MIMRGKQGMMMMMLGIQESVMMMMMGHRGCADNDKGGIVRFDDSEDGEVQ